MEKYVGSNDEAEADGLSFVDDLQLLAQAMLTPVSYKREAHFRYFQDEEKTFLAVSFVGPTAAVSALYNVVFVCVFASVSIHMTI
jgi:hypothetical protein